MSIVPNIEQNWHKLGICRPQCTSTKQIHQNVFGKL